MDLDTLFASDPANKGDPDSPLQHNSFTLYLAPSSTLLQASHVWQSSLVLGDRILSGLLPVRDLAVCELGAGAAYPSLACSRQSARLVVATDYPSAPLITNIQRNIRVNNCGGDNIRALAYCWGDPVETLERDGPFDLILMADTLWRADAHAALLASLLLLAKAHTRIVLAYLDHDNDGRISASFLAQCSPHFLTLASERIDWRQPNNSDYYGDVHLATLQRR